MNIELMKKGFNQKDRNIKVTLGNMSNQVLINMHFNLGV